ncbi:hypothetical protein EVAR_76288_1 [Eumeta japonica]|uniref:Uncharacterized protein n=1 Tax=Eumeta variegata TaxID=151549 RepID=A0A4C1UNZ0_EUMVA|nr:hypothetical protein EVAR_76288_1 [Eumeta japonica]
MMANKTEPRSGQELDSKAEPGRIESRDDIGILVNRVGYSFHALITGCWLRDGVFIGADRSPAAGVLTALCEIDSMVALNYCDFVFLILHRRWWELSSRALRARQSIGFLYDASIPQPALGQRGWFKVQTDPSDIKNVGGASNSVYSAPAPGAAAAAAARRPAFVRPVDTVGVRRGCVSAVNITDGGRRRARAPPRRGAVSSALRHDEVIMLNLHKATYASIVPLIGIDVNRFAIADVASRNNNVMTKFHIRAYLTADRAVSYSSEGVDEPLPVSKGRRRERDGERRADLTGRLRSRIGSALELGLRPLQL